MPEPIADFALGRRLPVSCVRSVGKERSAAKPPRRNQFSVGKVGTMFGLADGNVLVA